MSGRSPVAALYRAMKDGEDERVYALLDEHPELVELGADGCVAPPLISAVWSGRADHLALLLRRGADPNRRDASTQGSSYRLRALEAALWTGSAEMERALLEAGATPDFGTYLFRADVDRVRAALDAEPERLQEAYIRPDYSLLHVAAQVKSAALCALLLERGLDPNARTADGAPALRYAARGTPAPEVLAALVAGGAEIDLATHSGISPLAEACRRAKGAPAVRWLLEHGADPNLVPANRSSPLLRAVNARAPQTVRALLEFGADPGYRGKKGETAADVARRKGAAGLLAALSAQP